MIDEEMVVGEEDIEEEIADFTGNHPYRISDTEYDLLNTEYGRLCKWESKNAGRKIPFRCMEEDIEQELCTALFICGQRYKLQKFMVASIRYVMNLIENGKHHLIPSEDWVDIMQAIFYWRMRACCGPKHGFRIGVHDHNMARALAKIAPPDPRFEPPQEVAKYLTEHLANQSSPLSENERAEAWEFIRRAENGKVDEKLCIKILPVTEKLGGLPVRPSQHAPFDHDKQFKPYAVRFMMNASNKFKDLTMKRTKPFHGSVPIDEFSAVIPDTRPSSRNIGWSDQFDFVRRKVKTADDPELQRVTDHIFNRYRDLSDANDSIIVNGHVNAKQIGREINIPTEYVQLYLSRLRSMLSENGGLSEVTTPYFQMPHLSADGCAER